MAIIYSYPEKSSPAGGDFLVITDSAQAAPNKNRTKSLTIDNLASYVVSSTSGITGSGTLNTVPLFTPSGEKIGDSIMTFTTGPDTITVGGRLSTTSDLELKSYTSISVSPTGSSLSPNQNFQALTQDTLATLTVDPSGNVVRGEQEGTWTFTPAQLNGTLGITLIDAPGAGKAVIVTESDWMIKYNATGSIGSSQEYQVRQASNVNAGIITLLPASRINEILSASQGTPPNPAYGFCARDIPLQTRTYKTNTATTLHKQNSDALPAGVISVSIKLKYRIFDGTTF